MKQTSTVKRASWSLIALLACVVLLAALGLSTMFYSSASSLTRAADVVQSRYKLGDTLTIDAETTIPTPGGDKRVETCYLIYPNGSASIGRNFALNQIGQYTIVLEADNGGTKVAQEQTFTVNNEYYALGSPESYMEYGEINDNVSPNEYDRIARHEGVKAFLTDGDTLTFSQPINVYENTLTDVLEFNLARYDLNVSYIDIMLTDCYDPTNALEIVYWKRINEETYLTAGVAGSKLIGLSKNDGNGDYIIDGQTYHIGLFGTGVQGNRWRPEDPDRPFWRFNNVTLTLDTTSKTDIKIYETTNPEIDTRLVTEINNPQLYGTRFNGFTNGDVYLSITARGFSGNVKHAEVQIGKIMDLEYDDLDLVGMPYIDREKPTITVDDSNTSIYAGSIPVTVPTAYASDTSGLRGGVDYTVWYGYQTSARRMLNITNGTFVPTTTGIYTVVYTATDVYGNTQTKELYLYANEVGEEGIGIDVTEVGNTPVGSSVNLTEYTLHSICTPDSYSVLITLTCPDGTQEVVSESNKAYRLTQVGTYTVTYTYADVYYNGTHTYTFTSLASDVPVFDRVDIPTPDYLIFGATYSFEQVNAYLYGTTKTPATVKAYIQYDTGAFAEIDRANHTITGGNTAKVKYVCEGHDDVYIESKEMKIVDVGYKSTLNIAKYFQGDFVGSADTNSTTYTTTKNGTATADFVNPLLAESFEMTIAANAGASALTLVFTDFYDESNRVAILLGKSGSTAFASINGGTSQALASDWWGANFAISYRDGVLSLGNTTMALNFGFTASKCKFSLAFDGVSSGYSFKVAALCGQSFRNTTRDNIRPILEITRNENVLPYGTTFTTSILRYADVLSPSSDANCLVSVRKGGVVVKDVNGVPMEDRPAAYDTYTILIDSYGLYSIQYTFVDGAGRDQTIDDPINVLDGEKPTVTLKATSQTVKINTPSSPVAYEVRDNETPADKITVYVVIYDARGILAAVVTPTDPTFTLTATGTYKAYVYATDAAGNSAFATYTITATA